jgi:23S rRNA pseudouridine1911/1915/1917 synthase
MEIIFENNDFLVIDKPAGIMVHGDGRSDEKTIADFVLEKYPEIKETGEPMCVRIGDDEKIIYRPGIVHRLDKDTSGVMVIAKNQKTFEYLKDQFKNRKVEKIYNAIAWGHFKDKEGVVDQSIGRSPSDFRRWSADRGKRGELREAITEWRVLDEFEYEGQKFTFLEVSPKTGRTHQIRVHMKHLQRPLVCDPLYAPKKPCMLTGRLALHAKKLSFLGPDGVKYSFDAPLPVEFEKALAK